MSQSPVAPVEVSHKTHASGIYRDQLLRAGAGYVLGSLIGIAAFQLGAEAIPIFRIQFAGFLFPVAGVLLALAGRSGVLWGTASVLLAAFLVISQTPVVRPAIRGLVRQDPLQKADAVVVLASDVHDDGTFPDQFQGRILHAYELLAQDFAPRLVLTRLPGGKPSYVPAAEAQMGRLGIRRPVLEVGPVSNTHDEAVAVSRAAAEHGWKRVILVTDPSHIRRAAATFAKAGVPVLASPSDDLQYDLSSLRKPEDRIHAFKAVLYETVGWHIYRLRGWI